MENQIGNPSKRLDCCMAKSETLAKPQVEAILAQLTQNLADTRIGYGIRYVLRLRMNGGVKIAAHQSIGGSARARFTRSAFHRRPNPFQYGVPPDTRISTCLILLLADTSINIVQLYIVTGKPYLESPRGMLGGNPRALPAQP